MGQLLLTLAFAFSIVNFAVFLLLFRKQKNNYMFFTFVAVMVSCFGHWLLGFSESVDGAILSNKINYLGSAFLPMLMFFTLAEVCRLRIHPVVRVLLIAFSCFVLFLSFTVGYSGIYYKTIEFVVQSGAGNYVATYGWGHDVFNAMIVLFGILDVGVIVHACLMRRVVSLKNIFAMFALQRTGMLRRWEILISLAVARAVSATLNYVCNRSFVFRSRTSFAGSFSRYWALVLLVAALSYVLTATLSAWLDVRGAPVTVVKVAVESALFILSYRLQKKWVFG